MRRAETTGAMKAALAVLGQPVSNRIPQRHTTSPFPIPIFQEIPFALPLHKMPPMLERTTSYPLDIFPERHVHYNSLPTLALNELFQCQVWLHIGSLHSLKVGALCKKRMIRKVELTTLQPC
ncbi:Testis-expressed sequence 38 protein [Sciurus carolinensis]|uniref:Testis-expressed sequence 38 protein n=1 Tax=Sciurus carolinensis TaxID=30640 RepID=A0AA41N8A0_SCICA|nr:Testis-expressed sequence 38 protein [Sciurus carolinensis]